MPSAKELLKKAASLNAAAKYQEVIDLLPDELLDNYNSAELYLEKADAYDSLNKGSLTISTIEKVLAIEPKNRSAIILKANGYYDLKQYDKAIENFSAALELAPENPIPYYGMGNAYSNLKEYDKAIENYSIAIELAPEDFLSYCGLGSAYSDLKEYDKAIESYSKAIKLNPDSSFAYIGIGNIYSELKEYNKAIQNFNKSIEVGPSEDPAYYNRAKAYYTEKKYKQALADYQKYVELTKDSADYYTLQAKSKIQEIEKLLDIPGYNRISELVAKIKELLHFTDDCVTHYTSMTVARALILESSPLRLSEGAYLNDTSEGRELFKYLSIQIPSAKNNDTIAEPFAQKPFIGSFVAENKHDDLTLWRMYGKEAKEEAKGCAITLIKENYLKNLKTTLATTKDNKNTISQMDGEFSFYRVAYKTHDDTKQFSIPSAEKDEDELNIYMKKLALEVRNYIKDRTSTSDFKNLLELLNEITYLFKSAEYQYEHEIRLVLNGVGFKKHIQKESMPPRVYIELAPINPVIKKITLGPKVEKPDEWASALYYTLEEKEFFPNILISHLPFK